ncbi:MAG: hypothetical protein AAF197_02405 [Pseudomonadota bacterium]
MKSNTPLSGSKYEAPGRQNEYLDAQNTGRLEDTRSIDPRKLWGSQIALMVVAFALLLFVAMLLTQFSPEPSSNLTTLETDAQSNATTTSEELSPWSAQQRQEARLAAQEILTDVLDSKKLLEQKLVSEWGDEAFQGALDLAEQGDEFYKLQDYPTALETYGRAGAQLDDLVAQIPSVVTQWTNEGVAALSAKKVALARDFYRKALKLDANHIPALSGLERSDKIEQVWDLETQALALIESYRDGGELDELQRAQDFLKEALKLDPLTTSLETQLIEVDAMVLEHRFQSEMSTAFQAFFNRQYGAARRALNRAITLKPNDQLAKTTLQQALALGKGTTVRSLYAEARQLEQNESWAQAREIYRAILARDSGQTKARTGQIRAGARNSLDTVLEEILAEPIKLTRPQRKTEALDALAEAKKIRARGAKLNGQIASLEGILSNVDQVVTLTIDSNGMTDVYLGKAGSKPIRYSPFTVRNLSLKPGSYTLLGKRSGYQDVRQTVVISPLLEQQEINVRVQCETLIGRSLGSASTGSASE